MLLALLSITFFIINSLAKIQHCFKLSDFYKKARIEDVNGNWSYLYDNNEDTYKCLTINIREITYKDQEKLKQVCRGRTPEEFNWSNAVRKFTFSQKIKEEGYILKRKDMLYAVSSCTKVSKLEFRRYGKNLLWLEWNHSNVVDPKAIKIPHHEYTRCLKFDLNARSKFADEPSILINFDEYSFCDPPENDIL